MNAPNIVEVDGLVKRYGGLVAVDHLNLRIGSEGAVHGFLGPNGSGKTTTIRCLLGLVKPTEGVANVFGVDASTQLHQVAHRIGAIVENPKLFPKFTGRKNLRLLARTQNLGNERVEQVLAIVGLAGRGDDSFESYSLGMKQRLAIAAALLKDPDLLILDEPANGLDPAGIAEMRTLIRGIADQGKAVLVSSHQLAEIEQVCDDVTIIHQGKLVASGRLEDVRDSVGRSRVMIGTDDTAAASQLLATAEISTSPARDGLLEVDIDPDRAADVNRILGEGGVWLRHLVTETDTLESVFLKLTGDTAGELGDAGSPPPPATPATGPTPAPPAPASSPPTSPPAPGGAS